MTSAFHTHLANMFLTSLNVQFSIRTSNMEGNHELQREPPCAFWPGKATFFETADQNKTINTKPTVKIFEVDQSNATIG